MLFRLQPEGDASLTTHTHVTHSSSASDTHAHTHSHIPVGLVAPAICLSSLGQHDQTEASLDSETDTDIAQGSWPSFAFRARCG